MGTPTPTPTPTFLGQWLPDWFLIDSRSIIQITSENLFPSLSNNHFPGPIAVYLYSPTQHRHSYLYFLSLTDAKAFTAWANLLLQSKA